LSIFFYSSKRFQLKVIRVFFHRGKYTALTFSRIFTTGFASLWALDKDPTVWLDETRSANTCIPPTFPGNVPAQQCSIPTSKNTFSSINKLANFHYFFLFFFAFNILLLLTLPNLLVIIIWVWVAYCKSDYVFSGYIFGHYVTPTLRMIEGSKVRGK